jgi:predicted nucleotidyltransferase
MLKTDASVALDRRESSRLMEADKDLIIGLLAPAARRYGARLLLFGSRARGDAGPKSDVDLALRAPRPLPADVLADSREALEESRLPFRADIVDYQIASPELRAAIDAEGIEWNV